MATKVILKEQVVDPTTLQISTRDIVVYDRGEGLYLTEPVKQAITIKYDKNGYTTNLNGAVNLGVQYDHRVTWLNFDLDELIWHLNEQNGYDDKTKYNHYTFKLAITNAVTKETNVYEFDGQTFEIPRGVTKDSGNYNLVLMIEEYQADENPGNKKDESFLERFVAAPFKGKVVKNFYNPNLDINATIEESDQKASLIKPAILGTLADDGTFLVDNTEIGQQHDNFIKYIKFNPRNITAHLNDFFAFAIFKQEDKFYSSLFEQTVADDPLDDYSASHPIIAWIPTEVCQSPGTWTMGVIAFAGNLNDINDNDNLNGDYYFFVSNEVRVKVAKNNLTLEDVNKEPIVSVNSNMMTIDSELIIDSENSIFHADGE